MLSSFVAASAAGMVRSAQIARGSQGIWHWTGGMPFPLYSAGSEINEMIVIIFNTPILCLQSLE